MNGAGHILIIDDERDITELLKMVLEKFKYSVKSFNNPVDALEFFEKEHDLFDLVITDLSMPEMSGLELALKINHIKKDIPLLMLSGKSDFIKTRPEYINNIIVKPVTLDDLLMEVRKFLPEQ